MRQDPCLDCRTVAASGRGACAMTLIRRGIGPRRRVCRVRHRRHRWRKGWSQRVRCCWPRPATAGRPRENSASALHQSGERGELAARCRSGRRPASIRFRRRFSEKWISWHDPKEGFFDLNAPPAKAPIPQRVKHRRVFLALRLSARLGAKCKSRAAEISVRHELLKLSAIFSLLIRQSALNVHGPKLKCGFDEIREFAARRSHQPCASSCVRRPQPSGGGAVATS